MYQINRRPTVTAGFVPPAVPTTEYVYIVVGQGPVDEWFGSTASDIREGAPGHPIAAAACCDHHRLLSSLPLSHPPPPPHWPAAHCWLWTPSRVCSASIIPGVRLHMYISCPPCGDACCDEGGDGRGGGIDGKGDLITHEHFQWCKICIYQAPLSPEAAGTPALPPCSRSSS